MQDLNFEDILDRSVDDVQEPQTLPMGTWRFNIISGKVMKNNNDKGPIGDYLFTAVPVEAMDDVAEVELEALGDAMESTRVFHKIPIWDRSSEWAVVKFLNLLEYEFEEGDKLSESAAKAKGYEFTAYVTHADNPNDEEKPYVNLSDIQKAA